MASYPTGVRRKVQRYLPWFAGLVLLAGTIVALVKIVPNPKAQVDASRTQHPRIVPDKPPKTVPLSREARRVAGRFILTAVLRHNLAEAWALSGPLIRQDLTRKQWLTGAIPVVPFTAPLGVTPMKIDYSFRNHALIEVVLIAKKGYHVKPQNFWLELKRVGGANKHWLVWSWVPRSAPAIPVLTGNG